MEWNPVQWSKEDYNAFTDSLRMEAEEDFRTFQKRLIPDSKPILGIRTPRMRAIAKQIAKGDIDSFLAVSDPATFEEVLIRGFVISLKKPACFSEFAALVDGFLPYIDNWAVNDCFCNSLKYVGAYREEFFTHINRYLESDNPWNVRAGLIIMLSHYLEEDTVSEVLKRCDRIHMDHYYVRMGQAWLVATAYAKFRDLTQAYLECCSLDDWTFNKALQKCRESYRVDKKDKELLKSMKR